MEPALVLALVGIMLAVAYVAAVVFRRVRIPDVLWLLILGGALGPWGGLVDVDWMMGVIPLLAALAVIVILFDGALEVTPRLLRDVGGRSVVLSAGVFTGTTLACGAVAHLLLDLPWTSALLLGMAFGGAGIAIIVPLAKRMDLGSGARTVILLEAVNSDILVILGVFVGATAVAAGTLGGVAKTVLLALGVGAAAGLATGWLWSRWLRVARENAYVMTFASLILLYAGVEAAHGSGPLAVLLFGIVVGNAKHPRVAELAGQNTRFLVGQDAGPVAGQHVMGSHLVAFHNEIAFFIRAFFFVAVGAVTDWGLLTDPVFLLAGGLLTLTVAAVRGLMAQAVLWTSTLSAWDRMVTGLLFPLGLVTAAVSVVPHQLGIPGTRSFPGIAAVVIVLTNVLATVALFVAARMHGHPGIAPAAPLK